MSVKWRGVQSSERRLIGGSGQGTLLGGPQYIVSSSDVASDVPQLDKYRYFDDIQLIELINIAGLLKSYDFWHHVASDVATDQFFIQPENTNIQKYIRNIEEWTRENLSEINDNKTRGL